MGYSMKFAVFPRLQLIKPNPFYEFICILFYNKHSVKKDLTFKDFTVSDEALILLIQDSNFKHSGIIFVILYLFKRVF